MNKIKFINNSEPDLSAETLNKLQDNIEEAISTYTTALKTTTGESLSIQDGANAKPQLYFTGKTKQDGTGEASPQNIREIRNVGYNKNIFNIFDMLEQMSIALPYTVTVDGVTITLQEDGGIHVEGKSTKTIQYYIRGGYNEKRSYATLHLGSKTKIASGSHLNWSEGAQVNLYDFTGDIRKTINFTDSSSFEHNEFKVTGFIISINSNVTVNETMYIKIEEGTNATLYTPYNCGSINLKLQNPQIQKNIQFPLSVGQVLHEQDYTAEDGIHQKRKTFILNGTERWQLEENNTRLGLYNLHNGKVKGVQISSHFNSGFVLNGDCIRISNVWNFTDVVDFKNWLAEQYSNGTPVTIEYELENEEIIAYTQEQKEALNNVQLLDGCNNIECLDEIKPNINMKYYINNSINNAYAKRLDELERKLTLLEKNINV